MQLNPASLARTRCFLHAVCLVLLNALRIQGAGPPANDQCAAAELIPANGPFPYLTSSTDMRQATTNGDPVLPANCAIGASHSIWYTFTPSTSALYTFSTGFDTGTTAMDPILAVYTSAGGCGGPFVNFACNDDAGGPDNRAGITTNFNAGTTYYIVVWVSVGEDFTDPNRIVALQLLVTRPEIPVNDSCAGAERISPSGPFPYSTAVTDTMRAATGSQVRPSASVRPVRCSMASSTTMAPATMGDGRWRVSGVSGVRRWLTAILRRPS